jgi:hypothetical protein
MNYQAISAFADIALVLIAVLALWMARGQVKFARLSALLSLEQDMYQRRYQFQLISKELISDNTPDQKNLLENRLDDAIENYLNSLDRLSSCILSAHFDEKTLRSEYRDVLNETVSQFKEKFGADTPYRKLLKLHDKWKDN